MHAHQPPEDVTPLRPAREAAEDSRFRKEPDPRFWRLNRSLPFDWSMSYGASQASKASERLRRQKRGSGSLRKRPMGGRLCR